MLLSESYVACYLTLVKLYLWILPTSYLSSRKDLGVIDGSMSCFITVDESLFWKREKVAVRKVACVYILDCFCNIHWMKYTYSPANVEIVNDALSDEFPQFFGSRIRANLDIQ